METEYTKGFKAGMAWREAEIIKLLEEQRVLCSDEKCCWLATEYSCDCEKTIALIKGEK